MPKRAAEPGMTRPIVPVVLCGGSGTRLWPMSSPERPKQLLRLAGEHTMLQETLLRLRHLRSALLPPIVICNERHEQGVRQQVAAIGGPLPQIVLEPVGRNSAPAAGIAALLARRSAGAGVDPLLLVLPADHVIVDPEAFAAAVEVALDPAGAGCLTTFGVVPTAPATGYGYIRRADGAGRWSPVAQFAEKPDLATAQSYVRSGQYLWNSGMFLFAASAWLEELALHAPALLRGVETALAEVATDNEGVTRLGAAFRVCPADSIDYAVMEKTTRAAVVPLSAGWSDVGSWSSLHDVLPKDGDGNAVTGNAILEGCRDTCVVARDRLVAAIGLEGVVIVETDDAILVVSREHAEAVKGIAERANSRNKGNPR
jgi:mannose-1-phosphate guanylyltransferase/mannose-6-phosphate isomerase